MKPEDRGADDSLTAAPQDITATQIKTGTQLGPYSIEAPIGAGGMGQVFRARDTRLGRAVAIKVSHEKFSDRFEREARAIAALNHPHICTLHDVGPNYLVMELVEGETLSTRLKKGPLPIESLLRYGSEIADALAAAHAKGIIHRDLKPGNIMITKAGVKVLDFGLAKSTHDEALTAPLAVMGTPAYMAPEQLEGKECDARSDIYALGLVLREMATGKRGEPLERAPEKFSHVVARCLEKDPENRWQAASDVRAELEWAARSPAATTAAVRRTPARLLIPGIAAAGTMAALTLAWIHFRETPPAPADSIRFQIQLPEKVSFGNSGRFALAPDGRRLVFEAVDSDAISHLWLRNLDSADVRPLAHTEGGGAPIWSPDSQFIAFATGRKLMKIDLAGSPAEEICDLAGAISGGSWSRDGAIIFGSGQGVMRVSASGGNASALTSLAVTPGMSGHLSPSLLPDGKHFIYLGVSGVAGTGNDRVFIGSLDTRPEEQGAMPLLVSDLPPMYVSSDGGQGHLLYLRDDRLVAQAFDTGRLQLSGEPIPIAGRVARRNYLGLFSASRNGVLVYRTGANRDLQLTWFDRQGKVLGTAGEPGRYGFLSLSPDGMRAALNRTDPQTGNQDIWILDLSQGASTRFTFDPAIETFPSWSPDGSRIIFVSTRGGANGIYQKATNGAGSEELIYKSNQSVSLSHWSRDGRFLMLGFVDPQTRQDLWFLPEPLNKSGNQEPVPFLRGPFTEQASSLSPDSRWIAYRSNESGRTEVYVQPFSSSPDAGNAAAGGKWMVSKGGTSAMVRWRGDGKEFYYMAPDGTVMAVEISTNPAFRAGLPAPLFQLPPAFLQSVPAPGTLADVTADGKRFLFAMPMQQTPRDEFTVVTNWQAALKK